MSFRRRFSCALVMFLPLVVAAFLFIGVLLARPTPIGRRTIPMEPFRAKKCTWYCHNVDCRHRPVLPRILTSDEGAYGLTIRGLYALGSHFSADPSIGYGVANLLVFCVAWPSSSYALFLLALRQHRQLMQRRTQSCAFRRIYSEAVRERR